MTVISMALSTARRLSAGYNLTGDTLAFLRGLSVAAVEATVNDCSGFFYFAIVRISATPAELSKCAEERPLQSVEYTLRSKLRRAALSLALILRLEVLATRSTTTEGTSFVACGAVFRASFKIQRLGSMP